MKKIGVVIPTRNRRLSLEAVITCILNQDIQIEEVVVIDSSDEGLPLTVRHESRIRITYINTDVRSAAEQRNIGKRLINETVDFLAFLDDDVLVERDYFSRLIKILTVSGAIGVSGVAINPQLSKRRAKPFGIQGWIRRVFLLDSNQDGKLLNSGVNIPVRSDFNENIEVDWLIGCSIWRSESVLEIEFESDFKGQSLGEDVIFSVQARRMGILLTNPSIVITHEESPIERPDKLNHFHAWVTNRRRLIDVMGGGILRRSAFQIANIGQALIFIFLGLFGDKKNLKIANRILITSLRNI